MEFNDQNVQEYLKKEFQGRESFLDNIIFPIFGADRFEDAYDNEMLDDSALKKSADDAGICSIVHYGHLAIDFGAIHIFEITVANRILLKRNRVTVQGIVRKILGAYEGAFMIFHYASGGEWDWRFSFCKKDDREVTEAKRYTFLLGPRQACRTAAQNFVKLAEVTANGKSPEMSDIVTAFDVEALSREFFSKYKAHYEKFVKYVTGKCYKKINGRWSEVADGDPCEDIYEAFDRNDKAVRDYVKKLLGRIVFLHFLQKKGWLGVPKGRPWGEGNADFLRDLFNKCPSQTTFVDDVLEPLFDDVNAKRPDDVANEKLGKDILVPYLNGGLFERDAADEAAFPLPADYMRDLLDFFGSYNFTIDENDPNDAEVGVDPEMLSRIFENLLEDNKDKGAFYTPKSIVEYMCRESLTAYLQAGFNDDEKAMVASFVKTHDAYSLPATLRLDLLQKLKGVKICDPAIGSGAFPIGLLKELFACRVALGDLASEYPGVLKRQIIENNIYGVDIEKGAVDIARLRFWLALVVDEESPHALPNLDFKVMQGNSLLESFGGVPLGHVLEGGSASMTQGVYKGGQKAGQKRSNYWQSAFAFDGYDAIKEIVRDKNALFNETDHAVKCLLINRINKNVKAYISSKLDPNSPFQSQIPDGQNDQFFLWHIWFSDVFDRPGRKGFDIVIGNPPYIDSETMTRVMPEARHAYADLYQTASGNWDLFIPFVEQGLHLLSNDGVISYIIPNKIIAARYAESIRQELARHAIKSIRDYSRINVFENAAVYPIVIVASNVNDGGKTVFEIMEDDDSVKQCVTGCVGELPWDVFFQHESSCSIVRKVLMKGTRIADLPHILVSAAATVAEAYEVKKYLTDEYSLGDFKFVNTGTIDPYKTFWGQKKTQYIKGHYERPTISGDKIRLISENRLMQARSPKIIVAGMSNRIEAFLDERGEYLAGKSTSIVVGPVCELKWIIALLNSALITFSINTAFASLKMAGGYLNIGQNEIGNVRVPKMGDKAVKALSFLVDRILAEKEADADADTSELEAEIDRLVYKLYGLTKEEIAVVEKAVKKCGVG